MIYLLCAVTKFSVVFCQQVQTILVHADTLALGVFRKGAVQRLRKPQLELTGILLVRRGLRNFIAIFQRGGQPFAFAVQRVFQRRFRRLAAGQAAAQLRDTRLQNRLPPCPEQAPDDTEDSYNTQSSSRFDTSLSTTSFTIIT